MKMVENLGGTVGHWLAIQKGSLGEPLEPQETPFEGLILPIIQYLANILEMSALTHA